MGESKSLCQCSVVASRKNLLLEGDWRSGSVGPLTLVLWPRTLLYARKEQALLTDPPLDSDVTCYFPDIVRVVRSAL